MAVKKPLVSEDTESEFDKVMTEDTTLETMIEEETSGEVEREEAEVIEEPKTKLDKYKEDAKKSKDLEKLSKDIAEAATYKGKEAKLMAQREYMINKTKAHKSKCANSGIVTFTPEKIYAKYFGPTYTFLYNCVPVVIRFNGRPQKFSKVVADFIQVKIRKVAESNVAKIVDLDINK